VLEINVVKSITIKTSAIGEKILLPGFYYYFGSAQKNLKSRINRHIKKDKIIHWHIDQITANKNVIVSKVFVFESKEKAFECYLCNQVEKDFNLIHPIKSFGNSDCNSCVSHLLQSQNQLNQSHFTDLYQSMVSFIPDSNGISDS